MAGSAFAQVDADKDSEKYSHFNSDPDDDEEKIQEIRDRVSAQYFDDEAQTR